MPCIHRDNLHSSNVQHNKHVLWRFHFVFSRNEMNFCYHVSFYRNTICHVSDPYWYDFSHRKIRIFSDFITLHSYSGKRKKVNQNGFWYLFNTWKWFLSQLCCIWIADFCTQTAQHKTYLFKSFNFICLINRFICDSQLFFHIHRSSNWFRLWISHCQRWSTHTYTIHTKNSRQAYKICSKNVMYPLLHTMLRERERASPSCIHYSFIKKVHFNNRQTLLFHTHAHTMLNAIWSNISIATFSHKYS